MSNEKAETPLVTQEPGKDEKLAEAQEATEEDAQPSLNPLPAAWISTGASWFNSAKEKVLWFYSSLGTNLYSLRVFTENRTKT